MASFPLLPDNRPVVAAAEAEKRERLAELRRLKEHQLTKDDMLRDLRQPELPRGWSDQLVGYRVNDGTVGLDEMDRFEPVALVRTSNPAAQIYVDRLVERSMTYVSAVSTDEHGKASILTFTTGDDFLQSRLTSELRKAIIAELNARWEELRQGGMVESATTRSVVGGKLDNDKIQRPLEPENIYKPGFVAVDRTSPGSLVIARFSRALFSDTAQRLACLADVPRPTTEMRKQAYLAAGREGASECVAVPFQFWCTEVMRARDAENAAT